MNGNPALRILDMIKHHKMLLLVSALIGAGAGTVAGLTAPTLFQAESTIKIEPPKRSRSVSNAATAFLDSSQSDAGVALRNAVMLAMSKDVLEGAVQTLIKTESFDYEAAFPRSIHITDLKIKMRLMAKRLGARRGVPHKLDPDTLDKESLVGLIRSQIRVSADNEAQIMRINTEASTAELAQRMCSILTNEFINTSLQRDKRELTKEEEYLESTLKLQKSEIEAVETKMRDIRKQHPEIIGAGDGLRSLFALRHQELSQEAARIDQEIKVGEHLRQLDLKRLGSIDYHTELENEAMRKRVEKELGDLEFRRTEYTRVLNYPKTHPDIIALDQRSSKLRALLQPSPGKGTVLRSSEGSGHPLVEQRRGVEQMLQFMVTSNDKLRTLRAQQEQIGQALEKNTENLKKGMPIESEIASLARELTAHLEVSTELRRHLEEVKIQLVGFSGSATLLASPILPVVPTSLSTPKRLVFGLVVGIAFAVSALFLLDLINPRLRLIDDLEAMHISHFGVFRFHQDSVHDFTSCLLTLQSPSESQLGAHALGQVVLFCTVSSPLHVDAWLGEVARLLAQAECHAGVLVIHDTQGSSICRETSIIDGIETTRLLASEVPFAYDQIIADMRRKFRWVLVLSPQVDQGPVTVFMSRSAQHIFFITHLGKSELRILESYQKSLTSPDTARQHALIFMT
ncbi:MAG: hypothetical protein NTZ90_08590 [Proteobacteria bacterium]|nr:hypothetical protein [Pseudomonadota bacterium]